MSSSFEDAFLTLLEQELATVKANLVSLKQTLQTAQAVLGSDHFAGRKELDKTLLDQGGAGARAQFEQLQSRTTELLGSYMPAEPTNAECIERIKVLIREITAMELDLLKEPASQVERKLLNIIPQKHEVIEHILELKKAIGSRRAKHESQLVTIEAIPHEDPAITEARKEVWFQASVAFDLFLMVALVIGNACAKMRL